MAKGPRYPMPVAPFQAIIEQNLRSREALGIPYEEAGAYAANGMAPPLDALTEDVARHLGMAFDSVAKRIYESRHSKIHKVSFNIADAIVCATVGPVWWWTNDEVKHLYEAIGAEDRELVLA